MEPGETICESLIREVAEESGYQCKPVDLLAVEIQGGGWYRFSFVCDIVGGAIKQATSETDKDSLCAAWFPIDDVRKKKMKLRYLSLVIQPVILFFTHPRETLWRLLFVVDVRRAGDIMCLIDGAIKYYNARASNPKLPRVMVTESIAPGMFFRLFIAKKRSDQWERQCQIK